MNGHIEDGSAENGTIPPFFKFGTPVAIYFVSAGWSGDKPRFKGKQTMFDIDFANNKALSAVFALVASAVMMAHAIIPASPAGLLA